MIAALTLQTYYFFTPTGNEIQVATQTPTQVKVQRDINEYTLFGVPSKINAEQPIVTDNLPKTNLRLILRGVSASENNSDEDIIASALIEGPDKKTLKYTINDTLPGNAKLKSVYSKRVVIERNGRLENLYFPESQSIGIVSSTSPAYSLSNSASQSGSTSSQTYAPQNFSRSATNLDTLSDQRKQEIQQRLHQLREKMKQSQ